MITGKELYTINDVPGKKVIKVLGYVKGSTVQTKNVGKDILAGFKSLIGGEINSYTERSLKDAEAIGLTELFVLDSKHHLLWLELLKLLLIEQL